MIGAGIFYPLQNLGYIHGANIVWGVAAGIAGLAFVALVISNRRYWWAVIPGLALLAIAAIVGLDYLAPALLSRWGGPIFLGAIGLSFRIIYALDRGM